MKYLLAIVLLLGLSAKALGQPKGVISLNVLDVNNKTIAKATGFVVYDQIKEKKLIFTSFHLLNINLILAEKIIDSETNKVLDIVSYDEDFDLLVLDGSSYKDFFMIGKTCKDNEYFVLGYYKEALKYVKVKSGSDVDLYEKGLKSLDSYLPKGFSGAPVLDSNAFVCGLLVLSSEGNSNSIYVDNSILQAELLKPIEQLITISHIRRDLGIELEVNSISALKEAINSKTKDEQKLIVINIPDLTNLNLSGVENLIIKSKNSFETLKIENAANVYLTGLNIRKNLDVINSDYISISACTFIESDSKIDFKTSKNILVSYNSFKNSKSIFVDASSNYNFYENYALAR